ncbi:MAG: bifunctional riboflavin kinase/FAD synthetase [Ignavibacteria bacterium]|nr:bifunctional riboflavin kinase/FAD synthetase [Ignavibacteria bacterium]
MKVYYLGKDAIPFEVDSALTVGTFDGVHLGHQQILKEMVVNAKNRLQRSVVVTFHPHPQIVLAKVGRKQVKLLTSIDERLQLIQKSGIDVAIVIPFTTEFSSTSANDFVEHIIVEKIGVTDFFIGHDHGFGKDRGGNEELLVQLAPKCKFNVIPVPPIAIDDVTISSSKIRAAIKEGDMQGAMEMLGRPYSLAGTVIKGDGRGKEMGLPTANIIQDINDKLLPASGVYVVSATIDGVEQIGMANIGTRPTFTDDTEPILEVHFLDFDKDIYNTTVNVEFHRFLRSEQRFESKEAFLAQLERDKTETINFTSYNNNRSSS